MALKRKRASAFGTSVGGRRFRFTTARKRRRPMPVRLVRTKRITRATAPGRRKSGLMPDRKIVTLRYFDIFVGACDLIIASRTFNANSLFDPDSTGVGHQPRGFDQWSTLYNKYVVLSSTIHVKAFKPSTSAAMMVSLATTEAGIANDTDQSDMMENNPRTTRTAGSAGNGFPPLQVRASLSVGKYLNRRRLMDDDDLIALTTANPAKLVEWHLNTIRAGATDAGNCDLLVTIVYRAMFLEPRKFGQS